jgi:predicted transcriptional regulator of viral defense system
MPIDIETFDTASEDRLRQGETNAERVLSFLAANADQAFASSEIATETEVSRNSIGAVLSRLKERDLVRHRGHYWAIGKEKELAAYTATRSTARAMTDRFGPEDPADWTEDEDE